MSPAPAAFGRTLRGQWALDPRITYLNHGTVGAPPLQVLERQREIQDEIEQQPARFLLRELSEAAAGGPRAVPPRMRVAAGQVAAFLGARGEELAFVDNATTGVNAVLRAVTLGPGDEILLTDLGYGSVALAAGFVARERGASVRVVETPDPGSAPQAFVDAIAAALTPSTRLAIVDHVASDTALVLPVEEIAGRCQRAGVPLLVDGAHAPGMLALDLPAIGADWYVGNLHKWAWAPRSSGILWAAPGRAANLHAPVISWGLGRAWTAEFDWVGTRDPSPHLSAPAAIDLMREWGLEAIRSWNHELAWHGAHRLAGRWGTGFEVPRSMVGSMASVPLPERFGAAPEQAAALRDALLAEDRIEVQVFPRRGRLWVRVAAQIYNDDADFERLAEAVARR
jgi:isopenicillin-N epimerase